MDNRVLDAYVDTTNGVSQRCLYIAYGIVASGYALQSSDKVTPFITAITQDYRMELFFAVFSSICSIMCDYLQYFCRYQNTMRAVKYKMTEFPRDAWYEMTVYLFWLKQVTLFIGVGLFLFSAWNAWA